MTKITESEIRKLIAGKIVNAKGKSAERITDEAIAGFVARLLPSGKIMFGYQYTDKATGARRWMGIGLHGAVTADEARNLAKGYAGQVAGNRDPAAELKKKIARSENTVDHVLERYLDDKVAADGLRSAVAIKRNFANHVRPAIGGKVIYDLTRSEVAKLTDKVAKEYPRMAQIVLAQMRAAFNWWQVRDEKFNNPIVRGLVSGKTTKRTRVLTADELHDIWRALDELDHVSERFRACIKILILTGCRLREVAHMHTSEIKGNTWTIPAARYKTKLDHALPLIPAVKKLLPKTFGLIFSADGKTALEGFSRPKRELDAKIAEIRRRDKRAPMPAWTFHDLRRTARTMMAKIGVADRHAEMVLGHVIPGVEGRYNQHEYLAEKTEALTKLAAHVDRITKARAAAPAAKLRLVAG